MKKFSALILSAALAFSFAACGADSSNNAVTETGSTSAQTIPETESNTSDSDNDAAPEPSEKQAFVPNEDLQVVAAFVYDNDTYVVVENVGNQAILNYLIAYISFDKNGFVATKDSDGYELGKASTVNIMPESKDISGWYGADGNYVVAAIVGVDYADGTSWEADSIQIESWAEAAGREFSVEEYNANVDALKDIGALAETNEYAYLKDVSLEHENMFSNNLDLNFTVENTSDQGILGLNIFVLEFDENGFPVSVSPYDTYCKNGHITGGTINLSAGSSSEYVDDLFAQSTTTQIKTIITYIEFQDGTEWNNPYMYEWIIGNNSAY